MDSTEIKKQQAAQAAQAEVCFSRYEWDEAIACFDAILQVEPNNRAALDGKRKAQGKKDVDAQIQADLANARKALEAGRNTQARNTLDQAQTRGADSAILKYHAEIDRLREAVQEREAWQARVKEALAQASQLQATQAGAEALRVLNALLRDLAASGLDALGKDARGLRDQLQAAKVLDDQTSDVNQAKIEQDYRRAFELVATLREQYPADNTVQRLYKDVNRIWSVIQKQLTDAEQAVKADRLDDAVALLGDLRKSCPNNPDWKALWLQAHMDHGRALAEAGRQLIQGHTFDDAKAAFETAQTAFQAALDVFPDHPSAGPARDEVRALKEVAVSAGQAEREIRQSRWEAGRGALQSAREKLAEARQVRRREFSEIAAVLDAMWGGVNATVEAILSARGLLADGESLLTGRELGKAEERFRKGLEKAEGRDADLKQALVAGLRRAERAREGVERLLTAAEAADATGRVELLEQVYGQWPTAPGMPGLLAAALLQAAVAARERGDGAATARFCERVQTLPEVLPAGVEQARRILAELNAQQQTQAALVEAERALRDLTGQPLPTAAGYQALVELLTRARETARHAPEFSAEIERRLAVAQDRQRRLATAEPLLARAAQAQGQGRWAEAVAALGAAVTALEGVPAPEPAQRLARWQQTATTVETAVTTAGEALKQAQARYLAARDDLTAVDWPALDQFLALARRALEGQPADAATLPPAWDELQNQLGDLQVRRDLLRKAATLVQAGKPMEALPTLAAAATARPEDPVLGSVLTRLKMQTAEAGEREAGRLVSEARAEVDRGEWTSALEKLSQAKEYSAATSVADELRRLERQITLWQRFQAQDLDGTASRNNTQPQAALDAFRAALRTALEADSGLPDGVRDILSQLLELENQLHVEQADQTAKHLRDQLTQVAMQNRLVSTYLSSTVRSWYDLASRQAREAFVISRIHVKELEKGYKAALDYVNAYPRDPRALELASQARERLLASVLQSARKRLGRAEELRDLGVYDQAAAALADIEWIAKSGGHGEDLAIPAEQMAQMKIITESTLLGSIEKQFPEVFRDDADIDELRRKVSNIDLELQAIQAAAVKLEPLVGRIREAYAGNQLEQAQQLIVDAGLADSGKRAVLTWREIGDLQKSMTERQQGKLRGEAQAALDGAEVNLLLTQTVEAARAVIKDLEDLRILFNRLTGAEGEALRQRWTALAGRAQMRWDELQQVGYALQTAAAAKSPEARLTALERAAAAARGQEREHILAQIDVLKREVAQTDQMTAAWTAAMELWEAGDYATAIRRLAEAKRLGQPEGEVAPYQRAARAGLQYREALAAGQNDPIWAQQMLTQVLAQIQDFGPAEDLRLQVQAAQATITHQIEKLALDQAAAQRAKEAADARQAQEEEAAAARRVEEAKAAREREVAAAARQAQEEEAAAARRVEEAKAAREREVADAARRAEEEKARIEREIALAKLLRGAESLFRQGKFVDARAQLDEIFAAQHDHAKAQELLVRLDQADQAAVLLSQARMLRSSEQYEPALNLVTQARHLHPENVEAGLLQAQLPTELAAGKHLARARSLAKENQFAEARAELGEARKENPNHPRLVEAQDEIRRLETSYRDAMLQPVEAARRRGDYRGMLQQYAQIIERVATAELRTEMQQKQQATVDLWVDSVLAGARAALDEPKPLDELLAARDLMREVAALIPAPSERRPQALTELVKQIEAARLLARLAEGRQAFAAGSFDMAMQISNEVADEATPLQLMVVMRDADLLLTQADVAKKAQEQKKLAIEMGAAQAERDRLLNEARQRFATAAAVSDLEAARTRAQEALKVKGFAEDAEVQQFIVEVGLERIAIETRAAQAERDRLLNEARQRLATAAAVSDLEAARARAQEVLKVKGCAEDAEVKQFIVEVGLEIERFNATGVVLERMRKYLRSQEYRRVFEEMKEIDGLAPLLSDRVALMVTLAQDLQRAQGQEYNDPREALAIYRRVAQGDRELAISLQPVIEGCRVKLLDDVFGKVQERLAAVTPDAKTALAQLKLAETEEWITPNRRALANELQARAESLELTYQAAALLTGAQDRAEALGQALPWLEAALAKAPDNQPHRLTIGWLGIAKTLEALRADDLRRATSEAAQIPAEWSSQPGVGPVVQAVQADLRDRKSLAERLDQAEGAVSAALARPDPDYVAAVTHARAAVSYVTPSPRRATEMVAKVRTRLSADIERLRAVERYADLAPLLEHLQRLLPGDDEPAQRSSTLAGERAARLQEALTLGEEALAVDKLETVQSKVDRAAFLAGPTGDPRVESLRQRRQLRTGELARATEYAGKARRALESQNLEGAVAELKNARLLAPRYDIVKQLEADLTATLESGARSAMTAGAFLEALKTCEVGLSLAPEGRFVALRDEVQRAQRAAVEQACQQMRSALLILDLPQAEHALNAGRQADAGDSRLAALAEQLQRAEPLATDLRKTMEEGWQALERRDFSQAQAIFQQATAKVQEFEEPRLWYRYVSNLRDGVQLALGSKHSSAASCLAEAEKALRLREGEVLSSLWGARLRTERRRAVYYASRLGQEMREMVAARERVRDLSEQGKRDLDKAIESAAVLGTLTERQRQIPDKVRTVMDPPSEFDAGGGAVESGAGQQTVPAAAVEPPARGVPVSPSPAAPVAPSLAEAVPPAAATDPVAPGADKMAASSRPQPEARPVEPGGMPGRVEPDQAAEIPTPAPPVTQPSMPDQEPAAAPVPGGSGETLPPAANGLAWDDWFGGQTQTTPKEEQR